MMPAAMASFARRALIAWWAHEYERQIVNAFIADETVKNSTIAAPLARIEVVTWLLAFGIEHPERARAIIAAMGREGYDIKQAADHTATAIESLIMLADELVGAGAAAEGADVLNATMYRVAAEIAEASMDQELQPTASAADDWIRRSGSGSMPE